MIYAAAQYQGESLSICSEINGIFSIHSACCPFVRLTQHTQSHYCMSARVCVCMRVFEPVCVLFFRLCSCQTDSLG